MSEPAKRPPFVPLTGFIETAFAQRFQGMLRYAWREHTWHVIAAPPGSGKSLGIKDMVANSGAYKRVDGKNRTYLPILDVISPKGEASQNALIAQIATAYGVIPSMPSSTRRTYVAQQMARAQTELLIIDDAQDLSVKQLSYIKELTDYLQKLPFDRTIGLCFVTANQGRATPLKEYFDRSDMLWNQFRERLDPEFAYTVIRGHNENEVRDILATVQEEYRAQFPDLQLVPYAQSIYAWLIHPALDPENTG